MRFADYWRYSVPLFVRHKTRTLLLTLAVSIGVASVILLTSVGEAAKRFIEHEFSALGSQLLIVMPGKKETQGGSPPIYGTTPRDLTLEDMQAIAKIATIEKIAPVIAGTGLVSYGNRSREVITLGSTPDIFPVRNLQIDYGRPLPDAAYNTHTPVIVLGSQLKTELFGNRQAMGEWLTLGDYRFRVIGVLAERGESLGLDLRNMAVIPVRSAEMVFNSPALYRVLIKLKHATTTDYTSQLIRSIIAKRHDGEDDITIISQDAMLSAFNDILTMVTAAVGAIAAISLVVAGVLIMNVTFISVAQRRSEIGLLKAIGASAKQVLRLFVGEALLLTLFGSLIGLIMAGICVIAARWYWPDFPLNLSSWALLLATVTALLISLVFSWLPAKKAANLDPILALRGDR